MSAEWVVTRYEISRIGYGAVSLHDCGGLWHALLTGPIATPGAQPAQKWLAKYVTLDEAKAVGERCVAKWDAKQTRLDAQESYDANGAPVESVA
jgi:hypothetical protein